MKRAILATATGIGLALACSIASATPNTAATASIPLPQQVSVTSFDEGMLKNSPPSDLPEFASKQLKVKNTATPQDIKDAVKKAVYDDTKKAQ